MLGLVPVSLRCAKLRSFFDLAAEAALLFNATTLCHADPYILVLLVDLNFEIVKAEASTLMFMKISVFGARSGT